ncbi:CheR family methyltransferase [Zavarzinella formosa]|uniref:CheR family methyltransferase n=1 Tax=Zavarzinella formosa TaxID=360055 RepID=UPI000306677C|nr:CheR family methyltransferase [Zavarzinella formosa]
MRHPATISELTRRIGLNPDSLGEHALNAAIDGRMRVLGVFDEAAYAIRLSADANELQSLINDIVVSETWFYRGADFFETVIPFVRQLALARQVTPVRILSAACGTGEEPYSIAIALERAGVPSHSYRIDAVDLSTRNIDIARLGKYGDFSFRQTDQELRSSFFRPTGGGLWEIQPGIRGAVNFRVGNLMDPFFLGEELPYDLICCRNVFIYFTPSARKVALQNLSRLLALDGLLGLGHAESSELAEPNWKRFGPEGACLFQHVSALMAGATTPLVVAGRTPRRAAPVQIEETLPESAASESVVESRKHAIRSSGQHRRPLLVMRSGPESHRADGTDCWNTIGVRGDHSCRELAKYDHCHNCHVFSAAGRRFLDNISPPGYLAEWTERLAEPIPEAGRDLENVLIFRMRDEWLALPVACVAEVTLPRPFHRVPHRGGLLDGIINIRGELHLLVRVDELVGLTPPGEEIPMTRKSRLLVAGTPNNLWAFVVNEVDRVRRFPATELLPVPTTVARSTGRFSRGVLVGDGRMTGLLDEVKLFDALRARLT